jgi:uncharacterized protein YfaP (DUF2135 family)
MILWNQDDTDVDLHVQEDGAHVDYTRKQSPSGGTLLWDNTAGLGPEVYFHPKAEPVEIAVHYFGSRSVDGAAPAATLLVYWRGGERVVRAALLGTRDQRVVVWRRP